MDLLHAVFNHVVLPPKLPGTADSDENAISHELTARLMRACDILGSFCRPQLASIFHNLEESLHFCMKLNQGRLEKIVLLQHLQQLKPHHTLILYVVEQNAALIVRRQIQDGDDWVIFEAFEASPGSEQVLAAHDALIWAFPGRSVRVPFAKLDEAFLDTLTTFLEQASMESIVSLQAQTQKASVSVAEIRDTADPALITQMLMPLLEAVGEHVDNFQTTKRVRDDVNFLKDLPWRRLPFWLVLRVAVQRHIALGTPFGRFCYKLLMCIFLANFLKDSLHYLAPDLLIMLRAKLCRRMSKLEMEKKDASPAGSSDLDDLLAHVSSLVSPAIEGCTAKVEASWMSFKQKTVRRIPKLQQRASPKAFVLSLAHSGRHLDGLLSAQSVASPPRVEVNIPEILAKARRQGTDFTDRIFHIADMEEVHKNTFRETDADASLAAHFCLEIAKDINDYFDEIGSMFDSDPLQISTMLLNLFSMYMDMDKYAIVACPLLGNHQPPFPPELLNTLLLLPNRKTMVSLDFIQRYLDERAHSSSHDHILSVDDSKLFAVRYFNSSSQMQDLESRIESECQRQRLKKTREWQRVTQEYDTLTEAIDKGTCMCEWRNGQRSVSGCRKCWQWRCRKKIKIQINEELLPREPTARATVVFELAIPDYISAYRNATWRILKAIQHPEQTERSNAPNTSLHDCHPLERFKSSSFDRISLASAKKCFQGTHYKFTQGKISLERVLLPFAAQFELFDGKSDTWVKDVKVPPSLHHICGVHLPLGLEGLLRPKERILASDDEGLSSYEIQANQTECPPHMAIAEFSAYQKLLSGTSRRWRNILVELGASNINFSSSDATQMLVHLSMQAGPPLPMRDEYRYIHVILKERRFTESLIEQIEKRLGSIMNNWRETSCMELLINLCLKVFSLCLPSMKARSRLLLKCCRNATLGWITSLQDTSAIPREGEESARAKDGTAIGHSRDGEAADRMALYAFKAALLCRSTFEVGVEWPMELSPEDLISWVKASVALQENLVDHIEKLPPALKGLMIRDAKMALVLEDRLRQLFQSNPHFIGEGILGGSEASAIPAGPIKRFSDWKFLDRPNSRWVHASMFDQIGDQCHSIPVHYNILEGHLLYSGKPRGKLPIELRSDPDVQSLFGNHHLLTYASSLPQMTHRLATPRNGHEVHFGKRDDYIVIRALFDGQIFEYIPRRRFSGASSDFDLPASLMDNCFHWLNLSTGVLEIRREDSFWGPRQRNWTLDVRKRSAKRGDAERFSALVDPRSEEFRAIAAIFRAFVDPRMLTVFQSTSDKGKLAVEMKHLDLSFFVNFRGNLFSRELNAEVDPNQDLGTWYGLESKVVLRDTIDSTKRSVIIPLGGPTSQCHEIHVSLQIIGAEYGRFEVDDVLGRLTCAPEPRLVYTKALCHALTSFCLPDPLTKRTGTEEAFAILRSAAAQPWAPNFVSESILENLAGLVLPRREYYPPRLRRLQRVLWNDNVSSFIQHDGYEAIIHNIRSKSHMLANFYRLTSPEPVDAAQWTHLRHRGEVRRRSYERPSQVTSNDAVLDILYSSRDRVTTERAQRVFEIASMIQSSSGFRFVEKKRLTQILGSSSLIGGFHAAIPSPNTLSLINQIEDPVTTRLGDLISFCRSATSSALPTFCLSLLAFGPSPIMDLVVLLAGFSCIPELKELNVPRFSSFADFKSRGCPSIETIESQIASTFIEDESDSDDLGDFVRLSARQSEIKLRQRQCRKLAEHMVKQWPDSISIWPVNERMAPHIDMRRVINIISPDWERRKGNDELEELIEDAQFALKSLQISPAVRRLHPLNLVSSQIPSCKEMQVIPSLLQDLVIKPGPNLSPPKSVLPGAFLGAHRGSQGPRGPQKNRDFPEVRELAMILERFRTSSTTIMRQQYSEGLLQSLKAYRQSIDHLQPHGSSNPPDLETVKAAARSVKGLAVAHLLALYLSFAANDDRHRWLEMGGLWPDVGTIGTLELLRSKSDLQYGPGMKEALVSYGRTITQLQRLRRVQSALENNDERAAMDELLNTGHENWDPLKTPDMLLLEIESNLLIRPDQVHAAKAIMSPASGENSVFQMNMGKGKTSVILPIAAALLADEKRLVRLIVPKPLLLQTAQTLQSRLGGLVGREIRHVPFSRQTPTTNELLGLYERLHMDMYFERGVILTSHEHILSYKLGGLQRLADNKLDQARQMVEFQNWIDSNCRDVLDESDFTLAVKTQLNYPSGSEMPVDGHPYRWQVIEELLSMVAHHVPELIRRFRRSIEILGQPGWFPIMQFLNSDVFDEIHKHILDKICAGEASFLRPSRPTNPSEQAAIRGILSRRTLDGAEYQEITTLYAHPESAAKQLLIVRGLITHNIIPTCLAKRWNIQYGLRAGSYPVAVPYESRNVPSERAEWGHPDVAIIFTCLSFYYSGLNPSQFRQGLRYVLTCEDPASQYERWISQSITLPEALHHWNVINLEDEEQVRELWRHLHKAQTVINHFLNTFVFPIHAKQFSVKLQASAWDIPLSSTTPTQGVKTTGFSGTKDSLLPRAIKQDDLPDLMQTNAEVLSYLLQDRNRCYELAADQAGKRLSEAGLLKVLTHKGIRIFIDAGAYIIEMSNKDLARLWLSINTEAKAAVYFQADNRAWVMFRDKNKPDAPLLTTPFVNQLDECVVYLDEAHTRGVDMKFGLFASAALTLSLKQTKDFTVQAAMRLRQLKTTQRVVFFAPPEVDGSIRSVCGKNAHHKLDSSNVVYWLLEQTCRTNEDVYGLHVAQGLDFCKRQDALLRYPEFLTRERSKNRLLAILREPEHQTLEQLYGAPSESRLSRPLGQLCAPHLQALSDQLCRDSTAISPALIGAFDEVEQEREVEDQLESVREVQKPVRYRPLKFPGLHHNILDFARRGVLSVPGAGFEHAFSYIGKTNIGKKYHVKETGSRLFVSIEFGRTVALAKGNEEAADIFLRPVEWILWCPGTETAMVIIPEEAEELMAMMFRGAPEADGFRTHLIAYAAPVTRSMTPFNTFKYYALPSLPRDAVFPDWLQNEVGILAGRLYLDYSDWSLMTKYLHGDGGGSGGGQEGETTSSATAQKFTETPVDFLLEWLGLGRKAQDVLNTPVGFICMRRSVPEDHPFFFKNKPRLLGELSLSDIQGSDTELSEYEGGLRDTDDDDSSDLFWMDHYGFSYVQYEFEDSDAFWSGEDSDD